MADLTTVSTFNFSVQGNRRVVHVDVSSAGGTTSDTVTVPYLSAITAITGAAYRTSVWDDVASTVLVGPHLSVGSSANAVLIARSSLGMVLPIRFSVEGR